MEDDPTRCFICGKPPIAKPDKYSLCNEHLGSYYMMLMQSGELDFASGTKKIRELRELKKLSKRIITGRMLTDGKGGTDVN